MSHFAAGAPVPPGTATCCLTSTSGQTCEEPAAVHVLISGYVSTAFCEAHWQHPGHRMPHADFHRFGDHCNLPGARWIKTKSWRPGTCLLPNDLTEAVERFANQEESAHA
jgi:hypothetical protein